MENKQFKKLLGEIATKNGFESAFGGWFKESPECIISLYLQKSGYGNYYLLNIKIFIQKMFEKQYIKNKDLVSKYGGNVFREPPKEYDPALNLEILMEDLKRGQLLESMFNDFITPFTEKALSKKGVLELAEEKKVFLLPAVKEELARLIEK